MKTINVTFKDEDFQLLKNQKGNVTWRDFILVLVKSELKKKGEIKGEKPKTKMNCSLKTSRTRSGLKRGGAHVENNLRRNEKNMKENHRVLFYKSLPLGFLFMRA